MATAAGGFRSSSRVLYRALQVSHPTYEVFRQLRLTRTGQGRISGALSVGSKPGSLPYFYHTRPVTSTTHPPPPAESDAAAVESAEQGLRILRERSQSLEQGERDMPLLL